MWKLISNYPPPVDTPILTKVSDEHGDRNEQNLVFWKNLWWTTDKVMYVYYTPTHWFDSK